MSWFTWLNPPRYCQEVQKEMCTLPPRDLSSTAGATCGAARVPEQGWEASARVLAEP